MELLYKKAGHIELYRYRDGKRFLYNGVVQSISASVTKNSFTVADGNRTFDHTFDSGMSGQVTVNLNSFVPSLYGGLASGESVDNETGTIHVVEEITVPDEAPYTVALKRTPTAGTLVVVDEDNEEFEESENEPVAAGQYKLTDGTLAFADADAGKMLVVAYDVQAATQEISISEEAKSDVWRVTVIGEAQLFHNDGVTKADNLIIDRAKVTGDLNMPTRQKGEASSWSFTLAVQAPRPGHDPVTYKVEK